MESMRTKREETHYLGDIHGKSSTKRGKQNSMSPQITLENNILKESDSPNSNSENLSPKNSSQQKDTPEILSSPKPKSKMPKGNNKKSRERPKANKKLNTISKNDSLSNLDQSGVNESLDESQPKEEPSLSVESSASRSDENERESENGKETPNSSTMKESGDNESKRELRSSRKLVLSAEEATNGKNVQNNKMSAGAELLDDSKKQIKVNEVENLDTPAPAPAPALEEKNNFYQSSVNLDYSTSLKIKEEESSNDISSVHEEKDDIQMSVPIISINSPSAVSVDSAKGSSIANDSDSGSMFATGDLFWGRIHNFSYWACMICPDDSDEDNPITRIVDQHLELHVRFFADNARHNWVKRENLIPYQGLESYRENLRDLKEKFGIKSIKYQSFLPKKNQLKTWLDAVREADVINTIPYQERLAKFFELNNVARERNKEERIRRKSMSASQLNSVQNNSTEQSDQSDITKKRSRSESPASPAFSPLRNLKRRKTTVDPSDLNKVDEQISPAKTSSSISTFSETAIRTEYNTSQESPSRNNNELFDMPSFKKFHNEMKDFVMEGLRSEFVEQNLFIAVKNIWALKTILQKHFASAEQTKNENNDEEANIKRLSLRLRELQQRHKTDLSPSTSSTMQYTQERHRLNSVSKSKRATRPIEEVIDDIFNLDNRYLFDNLNRDPVCKYCDQPGGQLVRCSKGCFDWFHLDCMTTENTVSLGNTPKRGRKSFGKRRRAKRENNVVSPIEPPVPPEMNSSPLHVTADTDENDNKNVHIINPDIESVETTPSGMSHVKELNLETIVCKECANNEPRKCFVCHSSNKKQTSANGETESENENVIVCNMLNCPRVYHPSCLKYWPQSKITMSKNSISSFRCPSHVCHTCVSDDPKGKFQNLNNANTTKCIKCPATYHMDSTCIPAGSEVLTAAHIICPRHAKSKSDQNVNVSWCFICVRGGQLICCESCPTAVHAECSNVELDPNESYICDECESGRMPLYGEMVWAKFNTYRWWPAIILPPTEIPLNIRNKAHNPFEFVIRFFGTHDHGWISRRRVYLYMEGDWSEQPRSKKGIDQQYLRGVIEARKVYEVVKAKSLIRNGENEDKDKLHPQPYVKIRVNRAVPPVKLHTILEKVGKCECDPYEDNPCGPDSNCLNRVLYHECNPKICPAGRRCQNRMFEARVSPSLEIFYVKKERGFGLRSREAITMGTFVIEYVGEVIDSAEFERRIQQKLIDRDENYYFLHVEKDYIIDAGPKGNMARFMNHSCEPNCETQKWSVNGLNRVGIFAIKEIPAGTELTFNYHWDELLGNDKKICYCGSANCTGQIGKVSKDVKFKQLNIDEQSSSENVKNSKVDQQKQAKIRKRRKNNDALKTMHQKRNKVDGQSKSNNETKSTD